MVHLSLQHRAGFDYVRVRDSTDSESEKGTPRRIVSLLKFLKMFGGGNFENSCIETGLKRVSQRFVSAQYTVGPQRVDEADDASFLWPLA